jgi:hypothetical protein
MPFLDISVSNFNLVEILFEELLRIFELSVVGIQMTEFEFVVLKQILSTASFGFEIFSSEKDNPLSRICLQEANRKH